MAVQKVRRRGQVQWRARVVIDGRQQARFRATKREAEEAEAEMLSAEQPIPTATVAAAQPPEPSKEVPTLSAFAAEYLKKCNTVNRPQYARKKKQILDSHLVPAFGELKLDRIGARAIDAYRSARADPDDPDEAVGPKWINEIVGVLLHLLRTAQDWELIEKVPKVKPLRVPPSEFDFLDYGESDRLIAAAGDDHTPWGAMVLTALRTGLRLGELRGLRWRDVDLVAKRIVVCVAADDKDELHPPKSGRSRVVDLGDDVLAELTNHRHLKKQVFADEDGSILTGSQCRKALDRITRRAQLREIGWHVLRHSFASHLFMRGAVPKAVQELMGHATLQMTMRYAHLSPDLRRDTVRLLDRDLRGVTTDVTTEGRTTRSTS